MTKNEFMIGLNMDDSHLCGRIATLSNGYDVIDFLTNIILDALFQSPF